MVISVRLAVLLTIAFSPALLAQDVPIEWTPPKAEPILPPLPADSPELKVRIEAALALVNSRDKFLSGLPLRGEVIQMLVDNGPGAKLGLKPGDVIVKVDDKPCVGGDLLKLRTDAPQKLTYWRHGSGEKVIDIQPGKLGIWQSAALDRAWPVPGPLKKDARWDESTNIFARLYVAEPELAQIGLLRALRDGYPRDEFSQRWLAELALSLGHYDRAMDFAWRSLQTKPSREAAVTFCSAAFASNHIAAAAEIQTQHAAFFPDSKGSLATFAVTEKALTPEQRAGPRPLELAKLMFRDELLLRAESTPWFTRYADALKGWSHDGKLDWNAKTDYIYNLCFLPVAKDFYFSAKIRMDQSRPGPVSSEPLFNISGEKYEGGRPKDSFTALDVVLAPPRVRISLGNADVQTEMFRGQLFNDPARDHQLVMVVCGGKTQVELDGESIFFCDSSAPGMPVFFSVMNVGMKSTVRDARVCELLSAERYAEIAKAEANKTYRNGQTRLHRAAAFNYIPEAKVLIDAGANINLPDGDGLTPLHHAAKSGKREAVELLLSKGAKTDLKDKSKSTAGQLAEKSKHAEIAKLLGGSVPVKPPTPPDQF